LLELTIIIVVMMSLLTILFFGATAWKRGNDRAGCVLTLRNVQMAARSYQNLYGYNYGGRPYADNGTQDIALHLYQKGYIEQKLYDQASGSELCPGGGTYSRTTPDVFPIAGELYLACSLAATQQHKPDKALDW
jgi:hypothetical protein